MSPSVLTVGLKDVVVYIADLYDPTQFAMVPGITVPNTPRNFFVATLLADIDSVNGNPAKGTYVGYNRALNASPTPPSGGAKADISRVAMREHIFEILDADGSPVGSIMSLGFSGFAAPPGTGLPTGETGNWAIVGGTGAYLGARGQVASVGGMPRGASVAEDPANRITNHGNPNTFYLHVIPMNPPQIMTTPLGPLVFHMNNIPVTEFTPAKSGQQISVLASGLGPTRPDVDLGQPFPSGPPIKVNSPLSVTVNGTSATILSAVGVPGKVDVYSVTFEMPTGVPPGLAPLQLNAAWMASPAVSIWNEI